MDEPALFIVGYGSLTERCQPGSFRVVELRDHEPVWGVAMDNRVDLPGYKYYTLDGARPACHVAFLDARRREGATVTAVAFGVDADDLAAFDARERNYARIDVTDLVRPPLPGRAFAYRGTPAARARLAEAARAGSVLVSRGYLEQVRDGFARLVGDAGPVIPAPPFPVAGLSRHDLPWEG